MLALLSSDIKNLSLSFIVDTRYAHVRQFYIGFQVGSTKKRNLLDLVIKVFTGLPETKVKPLGKCDRIKGLRHYVN
jgi:hypothetical protein